MNLIQMLWRFLFCLALSVTAGAQTAQNVAQILGFENGSGGTFPAGWSGSANSTILTDCQVSHSGNCSARIARTTSSSADFSYLQVSLPMSFAGQTLAWNGWVKTQGVNGYAAIYFGEYDSYGNSLGFATTQWLAVGGTTDWTAYSVTLPVYSQAASVRIGALLYGTGTA